LEQLLNFLFVVADGIKPYDARSFPIPRNGLELGQEKSPGHNGSFLKVSSMLVMYIFRNLFDEAFLCCDL